MNRSLKPLDAPPPAWDRLRAFTDARVALGRAGMSQPTAAHLAFQLAHAQARDAVHLPLDVKRLLDDLQPLRWPTQRLHSAASDRARYLQRPDEGRRLSETSRQQLVVSRVADQSAFDLAFVVADGLSAQAVQTQAPALLGHLLQRLQADASQSWRVAPVAVVEQGRVAVGDQIGELLGARCVVVLIGERPGLSSPDSMGIYFTWAPRVGRQDSERNCISNIRAAGLAPLLASEKLFDLLSEARRRETSGIALKDLSVAQQSAAQALGPHHPERH